jgi:lipopolysaccharide export LptBFGC system permease protein LptF
MIRQYSTYLWNRVICWASCGAAVLIARIIGVRSTREPVRIGEAMVYM